MMQKNANAPKDFFLQKDCASALQLEFQKRTQKNSKYSLRAFARDLQLSAPRLSEILKRKRNLNVNSAVKIASKMPWDAAQIQFFKDLALMHSSKNKVTRASAQKKVKLRTDYKTQEINTDQFALISEWYHFAILELTVLPHFQSQVNWVAQNLHISPATAQQAIERLLRMQLLEERDGIWTASASVTASTDGVPVEIIRNYHKQLITKALQALEEQPLEDRSMTAMTLAFDSSKVTEAKEMIREFRRTFSERLSPQKKDSVYALTIQFFRLNRKERSP